MDNTKYISTLNDLLTRNYDAEKGYKEAAENVNNAALKNFFGEYANQRYQFGHDIKEEIAKLGGTPDKGTSVAGDVHRAWIDFKSLFTGRDEEAVLEECIRGENAALSTYNEALEETGLSVSTREVLVRHTSLIQSAINNLKALEETFDRVS